MKKLIALLAFVFAFTASITQAQTSPFYTRNDGATTVLQKTNGQPSQAATTQFGEQFVTVKTSLPFTPAAGAGCTAYHLVSAATTNATVVKNTPGTLCGYYVYNNTASMRKLVFHDTASTPTAGAGVDFALNIPAGPTATNLMGDFSVNFANGIAITTVTGLADTDNTAVASQYLSVNLFYK
jgi:hypothetical protein